MKRRNRTRQIVNRFVIESDIHGYRIIVNGKERNVAGASLVAVDYDPDTTGINDGFRLTIGYDEAKER